MKPYLLTAVALLACFYVKAQNCGSGPLICDTTYCSPDLCPDLWQPLCYPQGDYGQAIYTIRTDSMRVSVNGQVAYLSWQSFKIDSIWGLPSGLCWDAGEADNEVENGGW